MSDEAPKLYDGKTHWEWHDELAQFNDWNRRHMLCVFAIFGFPVTLFDIGCGTGENVIMANQMGIHAFGCDQLVQLNPEIGPIYDDKKFFHQDLRQPFSLHSHGGPSPVDMVFCWEVAEHIPEENHPNFTMEIAKHVKEGGRLIFTSAHPGQGGEHHIGEQPQTVWRSHFHNHGLTYQPDDSRRLALLWSNIESPLWWLAANVQVFQR